MCLLISLYVLVKFFSTHLLQISFFHKILVRHACNPPNPEEAPTGDLPSWRLASEDVDSGEHRDLQDLRGLLYFSSL